MGKNSIVGLGAVVILGSGVASGSTEIREFNSPKGAIEKCEVISPLPGGSYDKDDQEEEELLCSIDFYKSDTIALCPKTWSTSPGTMVYDITGTGQSQTEYESSAKCGGDAKGHEKITKFKQTMNQSGTSGTFAPASLLYYHLSRYFDTTVKVPVAVYRTMDKEVHFARVTKKAHEKNMGKGKMIRAGWQWLYNAEKDPTKYKPISDLFTADQKQIWGFLGDAGGERYGAEFNGVRSKWGDAQNIDFQNTPAFLALRSDASLAEAIQIGLAQGQKNSEIKQAMGGGASDFQMAVWMKELSEIVILDFILSQQDRVGNIDYKWYIYWLDENGKVKNEKIDSDLPRAEMNQIDYPKAINGSPTYLVQRTRIIDNDAGGRVAYTNYTKRTEMLQKVRHLSQKTYDLLLSFNQDLQSQGPVYSQLKSDFHLGDSELQQIVKNTAMATEIISKLVDQRKIQFDLDSVKDLFKSLN